jgi:hypothetical protein
MRHQKFKYVDSISFKEVFDRICILFYIIRFVSMLAIFLMKH